MHIYLETISEAVFVFPVLALLITLPYMLMQYHRYGAVLFMRTGIVYSFVFYLLASFFLTLLPLPDPSTLTHNAPVYLNLFHEVTEWKQETGFILGDSSTYQVALKNRVLWEMIFNIALLFPFGVYLHYYFRRSFFQTLLLSFLYSLFFEVTQLTGVYHIYPYSYRTFDVDDLFFNTLGGVLGFIMTPLFSFALPSRKELDRESVAKSGRITVMRRAAAFAADAAAVSLLLLLLFNTAGRAVSLPDLSTALGKVTPFKAAVSSEATDKILGGLGKIPLWSYLQVLLPAMFLILTAAESLTGGFTLGKWLVRVRLRSRRGTWPNPLRLLLRNAILYLLILPAPFYFSIVFNSISQNASDTVSANAALLTASAFLVLFFYQIGNALRCSMREEADFRYDRIAGLHMASTMARRGRRTAGRADASRAGAAGVKNRAGKDVPDRSYADLSDREQQGPETRILDAMSDEELEEELERLDGKKQKNPAPGRGHKDASRPKKRTYIDDDIDIVDDIKAWEAGGQTDDPETEEDSVPDDDLEDGLDDLNADDGLDDLDSPAEDDDFTVPASFAKRQARSRGGMGDETRMLDAMSDDELEEELAKVIQRQKNADAWDERDEKAEWEKRNGGR